MRKRLYRIRMSLDVVAYLDTEIEESDTLESNHAGELLKQLAKDYGGSVTPTTFKRTRVRSARNLPEGWDDGCIPYGINTRRSIEQILTDIKKGKEE